MTQDPPGQDKPFHRLLLDDDYKERIADISQPMVGPMVTIRAMIDVCGAENVPGLCAIYDGLLKLPTNVQAKRAELTARTMTKDPWRARPSGAEWEPDHEAYQRRGESGGLRRK